VKPWSVPFVLQHDSDNVAVHVVDGVIKRRLIVSVLDRYVRFALQQQLHCFHVTAVASIVQRCVLYAAKKRREYTAEYKVTQCQCQMSICIAYHL